MQTDPLKRFCNRLRAIVLRDAPGVDDAHLLERFVQNRDEVAFEALMRRHGPMVLAVCRHILGSSHDAEDAFQATFLVLARKARSVRSGTRLANWLHGVARRTALKARSASFRRRLHEHPMEAMPDAAAPAISQTWLESAALVDEELERLPGKYRDVFILCALEEQTHKQAAEMLGLPVGTLSTRLAKAKELLAKRLTRRGVTLGIGALLATGETQAVSTLPPTILLSTVKAAALIAAGQSATGIISIKVAYLMEGITKAMLMSKVKLVAALLITTTMVGIGTTGLLSQTPSAPPVTPKVATPKAPEKAVEAVPGIAELETKILDQRRNMKSGHFMFKEEGWQMEAGKKKSLYSRTTEVWFDADKIRGDDDYFDQDRVRVFAGDKFIEWKKKDSVRIYDRKAKESQKPQYQVSDPRLVGFTPSSFADIANSNDFAKSVIGKEGRQNIRIEKVLLKEMDSWLVTFELRNQIQVRYWSVPRFDGTIVRMEVHRIGDALPGSVESEMMTNRVNGVWYPARVTFEDNRKNPPAIDKVEISVDSINEAVDPKVFTLEGLNLPIGTPVVVADGTKTLKGQEMTWDGQKLVPRVYPKAKAKAPQKGAAIELPKVGIDMNGTEWRSSHAKIYRALLREEGLVYPRWQIWA